MYAPTLHLGGTSYEDLMRQYNDAIETLRNAKRDLQNSQPHGRDYVFRDDLAFNGAMKAHLRRLDLLDVMIKELDALREDVQAQQDEINRIKSSGRREQPRMKPCPHCGAQHPEEDCFRK